MDVGAGGRGCSKGIGDLDLKGVSAGLRGIAAESGKAVWGRIQVQAGRKIGYRRHRDGVGPHRRKCEACCKEAADTEVPGERPRDLRVGRFTARDDITSDPRSGSDALRVGDGEVASKVAADARRAGEESSRTQGKSTPRVVVFQYPRVGRASAR